jgi:type VI secretion system protein ImpB
LTALKSPLGNKPEFRKQLEKLLGDEESRKRLMAELGLDKPEGG